MTQEVVLITGANGLVAKELSAFLKEDFPVRFLTRENSKDNKFNWSIKKNFIDHKAFQDVSHIIHLAGANITDKRWTTARKKIILSSRVDTAKLILNTLIRNNIKLNSFISASAIGFYGTRNTENIFIENDKNGDDFLSQVGNKGEEVSSEFSKKNIAKRTVILRIGMVLSNKGGALMKMLKHIKYYFSTPLASGKQYMPWIHIEDLCNIIKYALTKRQINGVYNAVAPEHITNKKFIKSIAEILKKSILLPNVPSFILKILFGEMSSILIKGNKVSPDKILKTGFKFKYGRLHKALENLLTKS